jgi:hypothetical protein
MKLLLLFCLLFYCSGHLFAQYDYFDYEGSYDAYQRAYGELQKENIQGKLKELIKITWGRVDLHLILNKKGQIIREIEYVDSARKYRVNIFRDGKIIKETEYRMDNTTAYVFYSYNKEGRLQTKSYSKNKRNKNPTTVITYFYNDEGKVILRRYIGGNELTRETAFQYDGDSVVWKLFINKNRALSGVSSRFRKQGYERITNYRLDTLSNKDFKERIVPVREFITRWDENGISEKGEYEYDSIGTRITRGIERHEYHDSLLIRSNFVYNTDRLKGESSDEYIYSDKGHLKLHKLGNRVDTTEYEYDEHKNIVLNGPSRYQYHYDKYGNWILKQRFEAKSTSRGMFGVRNGVVTSRKFDEDTWITEEQRKILYN